MSAEKSEPSSLANSKEVVQKIQNFTHTENNINPMMVSRDHQNNITNDDNNILK